jgi:hypothetical protein
MIFLLLLLPFFSWAQDFSAKTFVSGVRSSYFTGSGKFDNTFLYYQPEYQDETFGEKYTFKRNMKFRVFDYISSNEHVIIDPLDVSFEILTDKRSFQIGFLRYRFSETFGFQLLDVANPRDYSEYIFNDLSWAKRSVFGMNSRFKYDSLEVQLMLTLWPNGDRLPYKNSAFDIAPQGTNYQGGVNARPWFENPEYGARFKYLFQNGFDLGVLAYHHFTRPTFNQFSPTTGQITPTNHMVNSLGGSGSYVIKDWVLRGDVLFTGNDFISDAGLSYHEANHYQSLFGVDRTWGDYVLGLQTQSDYSNDRHFGGLRLEKNNLTFWKPSMMLFHNYQANDRWFQLKNQFEFHSMKLALVYDNIDGGRSSKEVFGVYRKNDRILVDLSYNY